MNSSSEDEFFDPVASLHEADVAPKRIEATLRRRGIKAEATPSPPRRKSSILRDRNVSARVVEPTTPAIDELLDSELTREATRLAIDQERLVSDFSMKPNKLKRGPKTKVVAEVWVNEQDDEQLEDDRLTMHMPNGVVVAAPRHSTESETSLLSGFSESVQSSVTEPASAPSSKRHDSLEYARPDSSKREGKRPEQRPITEDLVIEDPPHSPTSISRHRDNHLPRTTTSETAMRGHSDMKPPPGFVSVYAEAKRQAIGRKPRRRTLFFNLSSLLACFGRNATVAYVDEQFLVQEKKTDPQTEIKRWAKERAAKRERRAFWKKWLPGRKTTGESIDDWDTYIEKYRRGEIDVTDTPYDPIGRPSFDQVPFFRAPYAPDEDLRQMAIERYGYRENFVAGQVDRFNQIVAYARSYFDTFTALISLIDEDLQWYKAEAGWGGIENVPVLPREVSFCGHTVLQDEVMVVLDTHKDWRFVNGPNVTERRLRFYAGAPITTPEGFNIGTFCLIDLKPRTHFSAADRAKLVEFADIVMKEVEVRHRIQQQKKASQMELSLIHFQKQAREWREKKRRADSSRASARSFSTRGIGGPLSTKSSASTLSLRVLETPVTEIPIDPRGEHNPFDVATNIIAQTLNLSLVYLLRASTKTKTCMLVSSFGLPDPAPRFDPSLHLKALRSKHGILYQNPEKEHLGPEDIFPSFSLRADSPSEESSSDYVSGMLIPVDKRVERYRRQRTVSKYVMDAARRGEIPDGKRINVLTEFGEEHKVEMNAALAPPRHNEPTEQVHIQVEDTVGYVLAAFTKNKRKVFGTEDLRYLQQFAGSLTYLIQEEAERLSGDSYVA